jgi:DNA/RNA-binding protein KIN17
MNSTQWATLTEFVKHLGRTGKCKVDETEKGWFVTYIDREPETLLREALKNKRERSEMADEERHEREIQKQIDRASKSGRFGDTAENDGVNENDDGDGHRDDGDPHLKEKKLLQRSSEDEKVVFSFNTSKLKGNPEETSVTKSGINRSVPFEEGSIASKDIQENKSSSHSRSTIKDLSDQSSHNSQKSSAIAREDGKRSTSGIGGAGALEQLMAEEEKAKEKANRKDYWLTEGLVVKVMSKSLIDQGLYKQKGVVTKVIEKYAGRIKMLESGMVVQVDQAELETVIPQIGGIVKIVNGAYRGSNARLLSINTSNFTAKVQIEKGMYDGRVLNAVEYEDICKFSA